MRLYAGAGIDPRGTDNKLSIRDRASGGDIVKKTIHVASLFPLVQPNNLTPFVRIIIPVADSGAERATNEPISARWNV